MPVTLSDPYRGGVGAVHPTELLFTRVSGCWSPLSNHDGGGVCTVQPSGALGDVRHGPQSILGCGCLSPLTDFYGWARAIVHLQVTRGYITEYCRAIPRW